MGKSLLGKFAGVCWSGKESKVETQKAKMPKIKNCKRKGNIIQIRQKVKENSNVKRKIENQSIKENFISEREYTYYFHFSEWQNGSFIKIFFSSKSPISYA